MLVCSMLPCEQAGLHIFFKIGGPKWPMEQNKVGHLWIDGPTADYTVKHVLSGN